MGGAFVAPPYYNNAIFDKEGMLLSAGAFGRGELEGL